MVQEAERRYGDMVLNVNLFVNTQDYMVGYKMQPFFFFYGRYEVSKAVLNIAVALWIESQRGSGPCI
jgi:hypothetical protein